MAPTRLTPSLGSMLKTRIALVEDGRKRAQLEKALQRFLPNCKDHTLEKIKHRSFRAEEPPTQECANRELYIPGHGDARIRGRRAELTGSW